MPQPLVLTLISIAILCAIWLWRKRIAPADEPPPESIVMLLSQSRALSAGMIAEAFSTATKRAIGVSPYELPTDPPNDTFAGTSPHFLGNIGGTLFVVNNLSVPYFENYEEVARGINELHLRKAIEDSRAWISVDILHPEAVTPGGYRIVAQVVNHWLGADCLALYHPPSDRYSTCDVDDLPARLCSDDPIQAVFGERGDAP